jgi:prophage antirepressor-like protein
MTAIQPFDFQGHAVRVVTDQDGEPWFVAKDVTEVLGYRMPSDMTRWLDADDRRSVSANALPGHAPDAYMQVSVISESGLYEAIFRSERDEAKPFRRWVTSEVLPAIRRHGAYATPQTVEAMLADPDTMIATLTALRDERAARATLEAQAAIDAPMVEGFKVFLSTVGDSSTNEAAGILSRHPDITIGERHLRTWMEDNAWAYRDSRGKLRAYQRRIDQGVLAEKAQWHYHPKTGEKMLDAPQVRVTAKGIDALAKALLAEAPATIFEAVAA